MWLIPSQERYTQGQYRQINGAVFFGFDENGVSDVDGYPQGGMNDKGLCFDANGLPPTPINYSSGYTYSYTHPFYEILWDFSTVNETIAWFENHYFGTNMVCQIHFADATGDAVVVSVDANGNWAFTKINGSSYLVSTNFNLANTMNGWYPCYRYMTASSMLGAIASEDNLTVEACRDVLDAVHQEGQYHTRYSNVFDLVNQDMYIYHDRNFGKVAQLNLADELAKVNSDSEGYEIFNGVFLTSTRIADVMIEHTSSAPVYSIVSIMSLAGITIIFIRFLVKSKK
jgi:choloylglycine hydrolase